MENISELEAGLQNIPFPGLTVILLQTGRMKGDQEIKVK